MKKSPYWPIRVVEKSGQEVLTMQRYGSALPGHEGNAKEAGVGLHIHTNIPSLNAQLQIKQTSAKLQKAYSHLSSGERIQKAADDPTGLAISQHFKLMQRAKEQNRKNAEDAMGYLEIADGAMNEMTDVLIRMRELGMRAATDTFADKERGFIDFEYQELKAELERIAQSTSLGARHLLNGEGENVTAQVGPFHGFFDRVDVSASHDLTLDRLGLKQLDVITTDAARQSLDSIDAAISKVVAARGEIGASESRLHSIISSAEEYDLNVSAAYSRIRDTDFAKASTDAAQMNILTQSGVAILAQANNVPQLALKLLS